MKHKLKKKAAIYEKNFLGCFQYFTNMFFVNMSGRSTGSGQRRNESVAENPCSDASAVPDHDRYSDPYRYDTSTLKTG